MIVVSHRKFTQISEENLIFLQMFIACSCFHVTINFVLRIIEPIVIICRKEIQFL